MPAHSARPGCYLCGAEPHVGVRVIDTRIHIDMEGLLVICERCIETMAALLGYIEPDKAEALRTKNQELGSRVGILTRQVNKLEDAKVAVLAAAEALSG
jgi:hypothetical protein